MIKRSHLLTIVALSFVVIVSRSTLGQQITNTGANTSEAAERVSGEKFIVWALPAEHKVRPNDKVENTNLVWSQKNKKIKVAGAGNEHVPFQVVITVPVPSGHKPKPSDGFFIKASDLTSKEGKKISKDQIQFYLEHYILLTGISSPIGATGYWPDALAPLKVPFNMAAQYSVVKNRPVWVDLAIPPSTPGGIYTGAITITQDGKPLDTLNLEVEVYHFSLPEKTHLVTYMNVSKNWLAGFYHQPASSERMDILTQAYYKFLYSHRMEPWFNDQLQPDITISGKNVEVKFNDVRYRYFMDTLKTNRVLLNTYPSELEKQITEKKFSNEFNKKIKLYLSQVASYFRKHGWESHLVFNSPIDEPNTKQDYEETREWATLVHEAAPGIPFLATESPVPDDTSWGTLTGKVNNFSIHGNALNDPEVKKAIIDQQSKGSGMTWYISCDQKYPQPNYFIDAPALDPVMIPWITARYQMAGFLYWAADYWVQTTNPWLNANTFISGFLCSGGYVLNGEGSLLYPGDYTKTYTGQPNVDGPVSSIRFELLREGIEDYDYLWMLKNLRDKDFADEQVKKLVIDVSTFSRNLKDLYSARRAMAKRLEEMVH